MACAFLLLLVGVDDAWLAIETVHDVLCLMADDNDEQRNTSCAHFVQNASNDRYSRAVETDFVGGIVIHPRAFSGGENDGGDIVFHDLLNNYGMNKLKIFDKLVPCLKFSSFFVKTR